MNEKINTINIFIDDKKIEAKPGEMIIQVADRAGIYIPRFCYHKKLSIAANCRMCLVEVVKAPKPLPACATPVMPDMKIYTQSKITLDAQRAVMEFLLVNHPLDCPICDQGGECELQDNAMGYGADLSTFTLGKRAVKSENIGPLVETEMTRCIHCTRCVRFGEEIAGMRELGATGRGGSMEIGTYVKHFMQSEVSANIIDVCPVGALTNKPFRYQARAWEMREAPSIAAHDCWGSNISYHTQILDNHPQRKIMRVVPRENEAINETWASDRDRFACHGLYHADRVKTPMQKINGNWQKVSWQHALSEIAKRMSDLKANEMPQRVGAISSPNATVEEQYLLQKLMRSYGTANIDHRMRTQDFSDQAKMPMMPGMDVPIPALENMKSILLIGSNIRKEQPLASLRVRKANQNGAKVFAVNIVDYDFNFDVREKIIEKLQDLPRVLAEVALELSTVKSFELPEAAAAAVKNLKPSAKAKAMAAELQKSGSAIVLLGADAMNHPNAAEIRAWANLIAKICLASVGYLTDGANAAGAWAAGAVPHRGPAGEKVDNGLDCKAMLTDSLAGYFLLNTELEFDCAYPAKAMRALEEASFVVCMTPFISEKMRDYADFILPIAPESENDGSFINVAGEWQTFAAASKPDTDVKPAWKVMRVLGNFLDLEGFNYEKVDEITTEIQAKILAKVDAAESITSNFDAFTEFTALNLDKNQTVDMYRLGEWHMYRNDNLVRRSKPLQDTMVDLTAKLYISSKMAASLDWIEGDMVTARQAGSTMTVAVVFDDRLAEGMVAIPSALPETAGFGEINAPIQLQRIAG